MTVAFKIGSVAQDGKDDIKTMLFDCSVNNHDTLEQPLGTDFVVTAGHTFVITKMHVYGTAGGTRIEIGYGDDGVDDGAEPTNWVEMTGHFLLETANKQYDYDLFIPIPAGKYPAIGCITGNIEGQISGIEIAD